MNETNAIVIGKKGIQLMPVEEMKVELATYTERRNAFREWLLSQLVQGCHYGFVPGCECKFNEAGDLLQFNAKTGKWVVVPKTQWRAKPSLYKAGASFIKDLLKLRDVYTSDLDGWKMLGEPKGTFVRKCSLYQGDEIVGEGSGCYEVGRKGMDANGAIKMADKRALVASVVNTLATCADLFTQDTEDLPKHGAEASAIPEEQHADFAVLVQDWLEESVDPESPMAGLKVKDDELCGLRAQIKLWCTPRPETAEEAITWLKNNAEILAEENDDGSIKGVRFARRKIKTRKEKENV